MSNIRLYDFLSFLLPGLLVSLAISFFFSYVIPLLPEGIRCQDLGSFGNSIIFLFIAFLMGHATQVFGNQFELKQTKYWGAKPLKTAKHPDRKESSGFFKALISFLATVLPLLRFVPFIKTPIRKELGLVPAESGGGWYSRQLLRPEDSTYDVNTKKNIRLGAEKILDVPFAEDDLKASSNDDEKKQSDFKNQTIFERANRLILQRKVAPQTEDFNSQYGFYRGICVALLMIVWLSFATSVLFAAKCILAWKETGVSFYFSHSLGNLISGIISFLVFDFLFFIFRRRYERFAFYFANSVYQNFVAWWLSEGRIAGSTRKENAS